MFSNHTLKRDCSNKFADSVPSTVPQNFDLHQRFCVPELLFSLPAFYLNIVTKIGHTHTQDRNVAIQRKKETCCAKKTCISQLKRSSDQELTRRCGSSKETHIFCPAINLVFFWLFPKKHYQGKKGSVDVAAQRVGIVPSR